MKDSMLPLRSLFPGAVALSVFVGVGDAQAATELEVTDPLTLSDGTGAQTPDQDLAAKTKIIRMGSGWIVSVFGDGAGDTIYDVKAQAERGARDIFMRRCNSNTSNCELASNWTPAVNLSGTAAQSSITTQWQGPDVAASAFVGDSDKPNIFNSGARIVVTWNDKYCPGGQQNTVSYLELEEREIPYSCQYVTVSLDNGATWSTPQQLSDGSRDAKQDVSRGTDAAWVITWQEDPQGLQLGQAEGPGDGASGAKVSHGTDIWYTYLAIADLDAGNPFPAPVRITDNYTHDEMQMGMPTGFEAGVAGASRANLGLIGPTVLLAYEETKGTGGTDTGKYIRYHAFPFNQPPTSCVDDPGNPGNCLMGIGGPIPAVDDPARMGCILSDPDENGRRVRFFAQGTPGMNSAIKLFIFWKQGEFDQGGPSDIISRGGYFPEGGSGPLAGFRPDDFDPPLIAPTAVNVGDTPDGCLIRGDEDLGTGAFGADPGTNLSANTPNGGDLGAGTSDNEIENALAHRGAIRGDFIMLGYSYTPDWAVATYTDQEHYNFWVRTTDDGGATWTDPLDLTSETLAQMAMDRGLPPTGINVKEPRIVKTPGNGSGCPSGDPMAGDTTNPEHCSAGGTYIIAWGTQTNVYEHLGGTEDLEIFITRTTDRGMTYEPIEVLAAGSMLDDDAHELESQLRPTPDGKRIFTVWNEEVDGASNARFGFAQEIDVEDGGTTGGETTGGDSDSGTTGTPGTSSGGDSDGTTTAASSTTEPVCETCTSGASGDTDDTAGASIDDDGCGCTTDPDRSGWLGLLGLGLLGLLRRRRA
jgi:MYXO-CTERM domain-containing protein